MLNRLNVKTLLISNSNVFDYQHYKTDLIYYLIETLFKNVIIFS